MHCNVKEDSISIINVPSIFQISTRLYVLGMEILNTTLKLTMISDNGTTCSQIERE